MWYVYESFWNESTGRRNTVRVDARAYSSPDHNVGFREKDEARAFSEHIRELRRGDTNFIGLDIRHR